MPLVGYFGAAVGVGLTCFVNGLRYLPVYRRPWEHVASGAAGAYLFTWAAEAEVSMVQQIEETYVKFTKQQEEKK